MLISVIIPCHNAASLVSTAIDSVLAQGADIDVVVVDDGSTDDSAGVIDRYNGVVRGVSTPNRGPSAARNTGLARARGDVVFFLDADDYYLPRSLALVAAAFQRDEMDVVFSRQLVERYDGQVVESNRAHGEMLPQEVLENFASIQPVQTGAVAWRRSFLARIGGWNEDIRHMEDIEVVFRAMLAGARTGTSDVVTVVYTLRNGAQRLSSNPSGEKYAALIARIAGWEEFVAARHRYGELIPIFAYNVARQAFRSGFVDEGHVALALARRFGLHRHVGSRAHVLAANLLGLRTKESLAIRLRPPSSRPVRIPT